MFRAVRKRRKKATCQCLDRGKKEEARARGGDSGGGAQQAVVMGNCGSFQGTGSFDSAH